MLKLRHRQQEAEDAALEAYKRGVRRMLIQLPTGVGKTPVLARIRAAFGFQKKMVTLVHRDSLAKQAHKTFTKWSPEDNVQIEMGDSRATADASWIVASVQTIGTKDNKRLAQIAVEDVDCIQVDEAHHAIASQYRNVFDYFGLFNENNDKLLIGVTATPNRGDNVGLSAVFTEMVYTLSMLDAIREGWLCPPSAFRVHTGVSLADVTFKGGVPNDEELAHAVDTPRRNALIVDAYRKHAAGEKAVCFAVNIAHAKHIAEAFEAAGIPAVAVWSGDPDREAKQAAHKAGEKLIFCNVGIATEGYDDPTISCVLLGRPTNSALLYEQMIGRGARLIEGVDNLTEAIAAGQDVWKRKFTVIDFTDNAGKHNLMTAASIFGLPPQLELAGKDVVAAYDEIAEYESKYPHMDFEALTDLSMIEAHAQAIDLFVKRLPDSIAAISQFPWYRAPNGAYILRLPTNHEHLEVFRDLTGKWTAKGTICGNHMMRGGFADAESAIQFADSLIPLFGGGMVSALKQGAKVKTQESSKVQWMLIKNLCKTDEQYDRLPKTLNRMQAQQLIDRLMRFNAGLLD